MEWELALRWLTELRTLRSLGGATERSLGARWLLISSLPLPPDFRPSFLLQLEPLLPVDGIKRDFIIIIHKQTHHVLLIKSE